MEDKKRLVLIPQYMKMFSCIGAACGDTCCAGWGIDLDKETYQKYKNSKNAKLKDTINTMVTRHHNNKTNISYGKIKIDKNHRCAFLNEQNLCNIYINAGEEYLSDTCSLYPRYVNRVDGKLERSATMSCPETARLALLNPEGIVFEQLEEDINTKIAIHSVMDTEGHLFMNKPQRYFWEIRIFSLSILQNRDYSVEDRLIILGIFYKRIEALLNQNAINDILGLISNFEKVIDNGELRQELGKVEANIPMQIQIIKNLIEIKASMGLSRPRYKEYLKQALSGLGDNEDEMGRKGFDIFEQSYITYASPYFKEKGYIFENFLVNEYFRERMPFGNFGSIWDSYMFLCGIYSMIKYHLIGIAAFNKGLTDEITINLIQSLSKEMMHNNIFIQKIINELNKREFNSLAHMAILLKN